MPSENPYAAPQTLVSSESTLPLAEGRTPGATRRKYPELSAGQLQHLLDRRYATEMMQRVWGMLLVGLVILFAWLHFNTRVNLGAHYLKWWGAIGFLAIRVGVGYWQHPLGRWFALLIDGVVCLGCVIATVCFLVISLPEFGMGLVLVSLPCLGLIALAWFAGRSCYRLARDPELFKFVGWNYIELEKELDYRLEHGVD